MPAIGLITNLLLTLTKFIVGLISNSSAIIAESFHSGVDVFSSGINLVGIRASEKPADREHPYGHYKAEVISGFIITIILFITASWIIYNSITSFLLPKVKVSVGFLSIGIMIASAVTNEIMYRFKTRDGKKYENISLISDGMHSRIDVLTSIVVLVGVIGSQYFSYTDSIAASFIGLYILKGSFSLGKKATDSLLDVSAGAEVENRIREIIIKEGITIEDLKTQKRGAKIFAQLDIVLPANLKVDEASDITKKIEKN